MRELAGFLCEFASEKDSVTDLLIQGGLLSVTDDSKPDVALARVFDPRPTRLVDWALDELDDPNYVLDNDRGLGRVVEKYWVEFSSMTPAGPLGGSLSKERHVRAGTPQFVQALKDRSKRHSYRAIIMAPYVLNGIISRADWNERGVVFSNIERRRYENAVNMQAFRSFIEPGQGKGLHHQAQGYQDRVLLKLVTTLFILGQELGIDPIALAMRMTIGETANESFYGRDRKDGNKRGVSQRQYKHVDRFFTPDLVWSFLQYRPWEASWRGLESRAPGAIVAGHYYPAHYRDKDRPHDLSALYHAYRDGSEVALQEVKQRLFPAVAQFFGNPATNPVLVPIPGREAYGNPNEKLAQEFSREGFAMMYPWLPRPESHGHGVEGHTAANKIRKCETALNLMPGANFGGRHAVLLDDCIGDGATMMVARRKLLEAGASRVSTVALTHMIRNPTEFGAVIRPRLIR